MAIQDRTEVRLYAVPVKRGRTIFHDLIALDPKLVGPEVSGPTFNSSRIIGMN